MLTDAQLVAAGEAYLDMIVAKGRLREGLAAMRDALEVPAPSGEPAAWTHEDGRVIPASTMDQARKDGGASLSSLRGYSIPLYATAQAAPAPQAEPVATLHDDGCFTWKRDEFRLKYDRQRAGWRMDVYAQPAPAVAAPVQPLPSVLFDARDEHFGR